MRDARVIVRGLLVDEFVLIEDGPETAGSLQSQVHATCTLLDEHNSKRDISFKKAVYCNRDALIGMYRRWRALTVSL